MTQTDRDAENGRDREKEQRGVKRPVVPAAVPEPLQEQIQANFIVVIHPGSKSLRMGRATATLPISVPQVIARRHKQPGQRRYEDQCLLREGLNAADSNEQRQNGLKMVDQVIWSKKMSNGVRRTPVSAEQARLYNRQIRAAVLDPNSKVKWTNTSHQPEYLVGEEALYVNPADCYSIHWPVCRGHLNIHSGPGGSLTAALADLETIWSHALQKLLEIPLKDLKYYRCILLIPDICNRQHVKEVVNMLLVKMGFSGVSLKPSAPADPITTVVVHQESVCATFGSGLSSACVVDVGDQKTSVCCVEDGVSHRSSSLTLSPVRFVAVVVHQESVCATFGSGLSSACVVDVGDQKTSVCCVEDGVSHRSSRLCLAYGGSDVTRCFFWLMQRAGFPFRECQLGSKLDCILLQQLKESFCHLDQDISGLQDHEFRTCFPDSPVLLYQLRLGDEKLQAPMALFYPAAFGIVGQKMTSLLHRSQGDAEDAHDEHFLLTTQSKQDQVQLSTVT
ncbi:actin-related protein 8-like [Sinocyclocheilus anshuiensis]|uniref:actin-related protein 8-like n=1 Tax=Sinocyclocheilus anshuiensis TaxID=1608454 RepID=UPI0007B7A56B|nr:PREDICTED: actin-related protein 8-like [Sinocyclocheilus anshuiensis]